MKVDFRLSGVDVRPARVRNAIRGKHAARLMLNARAPRATAYSFPEVLFAVIILGVGFIMIAGIFPVALSQSKATLDETAAAALARSSVGVMSRVAHNVALLPPPPVIMPATGTAARNWVGEVQPLETDNGWQAIRGSLILAENPRYAFVPLYRRDGNAIANGTPTPSGSAQIYVIVVQCNGPQRPATTVGAVNIPPRATLEFDQFDVGLPFTVGTPITNPNNLSPHQIKIKLTDNVSNLGADIMAVTALPNFTTAGAAENVPDAVAEGAYVVTKDNGRVYRVGSRRTDLDTLTALAWELTPGNDMNDNTENTGGATEDAWVVGRERLPGTAAAPGAFVGPAQDVAIYTTFIPVKP